MEFPVQEKSHLHQLHRWLFPLFQKTDRRSLAARPLLPPTLQLQQIGIGFESRLGSLADVHQHLLGDVGHVASGEHAGVARGPV